MLVRDDVDDGHVTRRNDSRLPQYHACDAFRGVESSGGATMTGVASTPRCRIAHIDNAGDRLVIHWQDRHQSRFDALWLRFACECASCGAYHSAIRTLRLVDIPEEVRIASTRVSDHGTLDIVWSDDGSCQQLCQRMAAQLMQQRC